MKIDINWHKIERTIGGMKFAVIAILLFIFCMIIGTFFESYYGTEFANRIIYKSPLFMFIQLAIFLSIIFATFLRLPPKKHLYGFYTIHLGLVIIGIGSLITYLAGIDGSMTLPPNNKTNKVSLNKDVLKILFSDEDKVRSYDLPYSAFPTQLDQTFRNVKFKTFIPFAETRLKWQAGTIDYPTEFPIHSTHYHYKNSFNEQELILSIHPEAGAEFPSTTTAGPLSIMYLPKQYSDCFKKINKSKIFFLNSNPIECFTPEERSITSTKGRYRILTNDGALTFDQSKSPFPLDDKDTPITKSNLKIYSTSGFEKQPTLLLFGKRVSFYSNLDKSWHHESLEVAGNKIILPWVGSEITLITHEDKKIPIKRPEFTLPIQKDGKLIAGDTRAVLVEISGKTYWVTNQTPLAVDIEGVNIKMGVTKASLNLPFELTLIKFKMDTDPGTNTPASFESFVKLFNGKSSSYHHIYMNAPLKFGGHTFYQSSFKKNQDKSLSSSLIVNVDPGRTLKYLGSLLLVLGAIWHYLINQKGRIKTLLK